MPVVSRKLRNALLDIRAAAAWYEDKKPGLGEAFIREVDDAIRFIERNPLRFAIRFENVRCSRLKRFPAYGVYYFVDPNHNPVVLAVFHGSRNPAVLLARRMPPH